MDKTILKNFAVESRKDLMDKIERKISLYYVDEDFDKSINGDIVVLSNDKHSITLTKKQNDNRDNLVRRISELGLEQVIEESAYTWFNRLVAIRYMEINDYLPLTKDNQSLGFRVLSSQDNTLDPEILKFTNLSNTFLDIDFNQNKYSNLNNTDEKFKYVLLLVCKKLGKVIPQVFDGITDYIDLLIPDNLLSNASVLDKLIKIPEDNFKEVEVIGWLYQYYISEEKDVVMSKKETYLERDIPYVTQIFTPNWIVKYMVENSLGRYWIENGGDANLAENWKYFLKNDLIITNNKIEPKEIKCIDPCSGSGHILVYMFEVLFQIYESYGYSKNDIPELIMKNNLFGLDIDDRAGQLSILSVILKAREYDKNIFNKDIIKDLNVMSIQDSKSLDKYSLYNVPNNIKDDVDYLVETFKDAKEIGSLLIVANNDYTVLDDYLNINNLEVLSIRDSLRNIIKQANILSGSYNIIVTNPPYMGNRNMPINLKKYAKKYYDNSKLDMSTMFMEKISSITKKDGLFSMINIPMWLNVTKYEKMRYDFFEKNHILNLLYLGRGIFGSDFGSTSFVMKSGKNYEYECSYYELFKAAGKVDSVEEKEKMFLDKNYRKYCVSLLDLKSIPGFPIAYSINKKMLYAFSNYPNISNYANVVTGITTGNNDLFLKLWYEPNIKDIGFSYNDMNKFINDNKKYIPYNKGGDNRKWYGNNEYVVNWTLKDKFNRPKTTMASLYLKKGLTWSFFSFASFSLRYFDNGFLWDVIGSPMFPNTDSDSKIILGLLNSKVGNEFLKLINPTVAFQAADIQKVPVKPTLNNLNKIEKLVDDNVILAKEDWDSFETSWDFKEHPLLRYKSMKSENDDKFAKTIKNSWENYKYVTECNYNSLKANEEELNDIFIKEYNLEMEFDKTIDDRFFNMFQVNLIDTIKSFISYAVGCMFGRYSLDEEGLIYAGGEWDKAKYKTFIPDNDNIIPIADNNDIFYSDDIVGKFIKFVEITFGKETLRENLDFIAETLGKKGIETSEDTIRRYFLNDFYKDHLQTYQKRPIYWMFDSGKSNGFKCLIYMHRYNEQTVSKIKVDYFLKVQESYRNQLAAVQERLNGVNGLTTAEIKELRNKEKDLTDKLKECKDYYEKLDHIANEMIKIDLDDGVKVNYAKFEDILAKNK